MVYLSTYGNPLYCTSDLRQICYATHPTYQHVFLQLLYGLIFAAPGPLACPSRSARPRNCLNLTKPSNNTKKQLAQVRYCSRTKSQQVRSSVGGMLRIDDVTLPFSHFMPNFNPERNYIQTKQKRICVKMMFFGSFSSFLIWLRI